MLGVHVIVPGVEPTITSIENVLLLPTQPEGSAHVYDTPGTAVTLYVSFAPITGLMLPIIALG